MQRLLGIVFIFVLLLTSVGLAGAQEPPIGSPADNACNEGGAMAGKCGNSEWAWTCGWHLARWLTRGGWGGTYAMPDTCAILLPPRPIVVQTSSAFSVGACLFDGTSAYANFNGSYFLLSPFEYFTDPSCTVSGGFTVAGKVVYAPAPFDANTLCLAAFGTTVLMGPFGDDIYTCNL
jgi:hypothetical protein